MSLLAHHESPTIVYALLTLGGPALLAFRCWLWERKHKAETTEDGGDE